MTRVYDSFKWFSLLFFGSIYGFLCYMCNIRYNMSVRLVTVFFVDS